MADWALAPRVAALRPSRREDPMDANGVRPNYICIYTQTFISIQ